VSVWAIPDGENSMISSVFSTQYQRETDGHAAVVKMLYITSHHIGLV